MQALVLHKVGDARYETVPRPTAGPGEVLVRVGFCGVCGSDIPRTFVKGTYHFPTICGHEFAGTVESCGAEVADYRPGDRVVVFPLLWCGRCTACERGNYVQCADYDYYGSRRDGAFAEYVAVPPRNLLRVPEGVSMEAASMTEPAAVALHALKRAGGGFLGADGGHLRRRPDRTDDRPMGPHDGRRADPGVRSHRREAGHGAAARLSPGLQRPRVQAGRADPRDDRTATGRRCASRRPACPPP